jgi:hypothetical protein
MKTLIRFINIPLSLMLGTTLGILWQRNDISTMTVIVSLVLGSLAITLLKFALKHRFGVK